MGRPKLILSNSLSFQLPLRFFLTAPLFAVVAAITMILYGHHPPMDRWSPEILATTHLLALGYIVMVMQGATVQVISVLAGGKAEWSDPVALFMFLSLTAGVILLATAFLGGSMGLFRLSLLSLGISFFLFFALSTTALIKGSARNDVKLRIALALVGLAAAVTSGIVLAAGYGWSEIPIMRQWTDNHLVWGLMGGVGILVVSLSYELVPMFQVTPPYPERLKPWMVAGLLAALLLYSVNEEISTLLLAVGYSIFALLTLNIQARRKRKERDATVQFWRLAMLSLLSTALLWATTQGSHPLILGILMIIGFSISVINGMLYKILPFLVWVHLSTRVGKLGLSRRLIPNIKTIIPQGMANTQFWIHLVSLLLIVIGVWLPTIEITVPSMIPVLAYMLFILSNILLLWNLSIAVRTYRERRAEIERASISSPDEQHR